MSVTVNDQIVLKTTFISVNIGNPCLYRLAHSETKRICTSFSTIEMAGVQLAVDKERVSFRPTDEAKVNTLVLV